MTTALLFLEPLLQVPISVPPTMSWLIGDIRRVQVTLDFNLRITLTAKHGIPIEHLFTSRYAETA
ncbi:hypothetical protein BGY98DRAFT_948282 [Russula aff. rugulosa BPL654]|nr:hypothetical protein BGY98DRAFT_948282 [Russula aff. rugulosa BPL654]